MHRKIAILELPKKLNQHNIQQTTLPQTYQLSPLRIITVEHDYSRRPLI